MSVIVLHCGPCVAGDLITRLRCSRAPTSLATGAGFSHAPAFTYGRRDESLQIAALAAVLGIEHRSYKYRAVSPSDVPLCKNEKMVVLHRRDPSNKLKDIPRFLHDCAVMGCHAECRGLNISDRAQTNTIIQSLFNKHPSPKGIPMTE